MRVEQMGIVLDTETLGLISLFENITRARVKDCIPVDDNSRVIFVVELGTLKQALGKGGDNIRRVRDKIKKVIDVIEYSSNAAKFVKNIFHNYKVIEVKIETGSSGPTAYVKVDPKDKGRAIGREGRNLKLARMILLRHHKEISNIMVL